MIAMRSEAGQTLRRRAGVVVSRLRARYSADGAELGQRVRFGPGVKCVGAHLGKLVIGDDVEIGAGTTLTVAAGGELRIGEGVFISRLCTIAAVGHVSIGPESMLGELVSIRDADHDPSHPPRAGRTQQADVRIGARVWIGAKASVVRGGGVGDDAVVGAHALVNRPVPARSLAAGVPARVVRTEIRTEGG